MFHISQSALLSWAERAVQGFRSAGVSYTYHCTTTKPPKNEIYIKTRAWPPFFGLPALLHGLQNVVLHTTQRGSTKPPKMRSPNIKALPPFLLRQSFQDSSAENSTQAAAASIPASARPPPPPPARPPLPPAAVQSVVDRAVSSSRAALGCATGSVCDALSAG